MYSIATMITLSAEQRTGTAKALRGAEKIPAVYYGKGSDAVSVAIDAREFAKVYKEAGTTTVIALTIGGEKIPVLVHDIQRDIRLGEPTHIDFLVVDMKKEIEIDVPLEFTGTAEAEKSGLGNLVKAAFEIKVQALPTNIPQSIVVDVTSIATLEDQIKAGDITLPAGVTLVTDAEEVVALATAFAEEKETPTLDVNAVEVEQKGKKDEE